MSLPDPVVSVVGPYLVVRDDLLPGGTKRRIAHALFADHPNASEFVYASPAQGYAQEALARAGLDLGVKISIFVAKRNERHERTKTASELGARIHEIAPGYLANVTSKARAYAATKSGAVLLPFGLDCQAAIMGIATVACGLGIDPAEVWCAAGSGTLTRGLQLAWPHARHHAVRVGKMPDFGKARIYVAKEGFEQRAKLPPPFPSSPEYDAKVWRFLIQHATKGALFWNVGA